MFYDKKIINSEKLGNLWKLAHCLNVSDEKLEKENLIDICEELDYRITSTSNRARRRLSLRASAHLLTGGANMYKCKINKLFDDVNKLNEDLIWRRKRTYNNSPSSSETSSSSESIVPEQMKRGNTIDFGSSESSGSSGPKATPEEMRQAKTIEFVSDTSFSPAKKKKFEMLSKRNTPLFTTSKSSTDISSTDREYQETCEDPSSNGIDNLEPENDGRPSERSSEINVENTVEESLSMQTPTMLNKETQTSSTLVDGNPIITSVSAEGFNQNLPFAYIVIHDNIATRVPSKIIISSITYNLNSIH